MKKRIGLAYLAALALVCSAAHAEDTGGKPAGTPPAAPLEKQEAQLKAASPALVVVEYTLQYDKGDAPEGGGFTQKCPLCGHYHTDGIGDIVKEERPLERAGFLVDATHVVTADAQIHPRFIKSIAVRRYTNDAAGAKSVSAVISGYPKSQNATMLELSAPIEGATPANFDAKREGPFSLVTLSQSDGQWATGVQGFGSSLVLEGDKKLLSAPPGLVIDKTGAAVGITTGVDLAADESWKGSPAQWPMISAADMKKSLESLDQRAAKGIVRVMLNFRSPKNVTAEQNYQGNNPGATVQYVLGVVTDDHTVLILSEMKPTVTARLERIKVFTDPPVEAKFKASLKDYGALIATTEKPMSGAGMGMSTTDFLALNGAALPSAEVYLQGDKRVSFVQPRRIAGATVGWRRNLYPEVTGETRGLFLFDPQGAVLAMPLAQREKASTESRYGGGQGNWLITPIAQVNTALSDLKTSTDPGNVPLTEAQESRLAWVGMEMQPMNTELARANNVSDLTNDGDTGALVTFVYPDSPMGKAGVQPGWVLLRINAADQPKPIDVHVQNEMFAERPFPWDRLEQAPEAAFDQILEVSPWPRAENAVVRAITDLGFGNKYTLEFFHDGKVDPKSFTVVEGPTYFDNAPKYKSAALGMTVKDLTFEVRRYMQKKPEDPGVIIGKIEAGSRASKAGLKPYEVITHVNDQPVKNVQDFEKLMKDQTEVRLNVKIMTKGQIVKVKLTDAATSEPAGDESPKKSAEKLPPAAPKIPE